MAGVDMVHVPYRGPMLTDLIGGQVQVAFDPLPAEADIPHTSLEWRCDAIDPACVKTHTSAKRRKHNSQLGHERVAFAAMRGLGAPAASATTTMLYPSISKPASLRALDAVPGGLVRD